MANEITVINRSDLKYVKLIGEGGYGSVYQMTWTGQQGPIRSCQKVNEARCT